MIGLRPHHQIHRRLTRHDFRSLSLGDTTGHRQQHFSAGFGLFRFQGPEPTQLRIDFLGRLFPDVTGVEDHHVGALGRIRLGIAQRRQQIRHLGGIIGVHLAAIGFDEQLLHAGAGYRGGGPGIQGKVQAEARPAKASA